MELIVHEMSARELADAVERRMIAKRQARILPDAMDWHRVQSVVRLGVSVQDYPDFPVFLEEKQRRRLLHVAHVVAKLRKPQTPLPPKLSKEAKGDLLELARNSRAIYASRDDVDEIFATIHAEFPWLQCLTEAAWRSAMRRTSDGRLFGFDPIVALGPPGLGKSSWARRLAELASLPAVEVDASATGGVFELQGSDHRWSNGSPGRVVSGILSSHIANPLAIVDELDAGSERIATASGSNMSGLHSVLLGMLEKTTARAWVCPYFGLKFDLSGVSWIFTSNSLNGVPPALRSRLTVVKLEEMSRAQLLALCRSEGGALGLDLDVVEACERVISGLMRDGRRVDLRTVSKVLNSARERMSRPLLN